MDWERKSNASYIGLELLYVQSETLTTETRYIYGNGGRDLRDENVSRECGRMKKRNTG